MTREPSNPSCRPLLVLLALALGCSGGSEGGTPEGKTSPDNLATIPSSLCADAAQVARLYPTDKLTRNDSLRKRVLAVAWARHKSGLPHDVHGDEVKRWYRNTDLKFIEKAGALEVDYRLEHGDEGEDPERTKWTKTCEVCGDLLVCGDEFATLRVRDGDLEGTEMTWLDFAAYVSVGERSYYFQRFDREVAVQFEADPMTADSGTAKVRMRKLEKGAAAVEDAATFESEAYGVGDRKVRLELPGDVGRLTFIFRDTGDGHLEGGRGPEFIPEATLFDIEKMQRHPMLRD